MSFDTLGLRPESLRAIADQGYTEPTPVQAQAIPAILDGRDLLAGAQTGTGKTAAFALPIMENLHATREPGPVKLRALVIVPTRELALQVEQSFRTYGAHRPVRSTTIFGGMRMDRQVRALRKGVEVVVATPGRLLDHVRQHTIDLTRIEMLVLDEADRMLDMGFLPDIKRILALLPAERQSLLFSATYTPRIRKLAEELLRDPVSIDVAPRNAAAAPVRQVVHPVDRGRKHQLLTQMLRSSDFGQVLVFTRTKRGANRLAEQLAKGGISAAAIHGNKSQSQRVRALNQFKKGQSQVLVATDIAARGLDIEALPHVVNYELPNVPEDYVHRIGRTGRAGQTGTAISLMAVDEQEHMHGIERLLKKEIEREVVTGFEPTFRVIAVADAARPGRRQGGRKHGGGGSGHQARSSGGAGQPRRHGPSGGQAWNGKRRRSGERPGQHTGPAQGWSGHRSAPDAAVGAAQDAGQEFRAMPGERISGSRSGGGRRPDQRRRRRRR